MGRRATATNHQGDERERRKARRARRAERFDADTLPRGGPALSPQGALALQRTGGNRATRSLIQDQRGRTAEPEPLERPTHVIGVGRAGENTAQRLWLTYGDGGPEVMAGKVLEPFQVRKGTGTHQNLRWNRKRGGYNTGFWRVQSDRGLQLHVHFGNGGGLVSKSGIAHHFKRGGKQQGAVTNDDLKNTFGSTKVTDWNADSYEIK